MRNDGYTFNVECPVCGNAQTISERDTPCEFCGEALEEEYNRAERKWWDREDERRTFKLFQEGV